jgi:hypothetical protein
VPRVLAAIRERRELRWWRRSWWNWPPAAKLAFVVLALSVAGLVLGGGWMVENIDGFSSAILDWFKNLPSLLDPAAPLANAAGLVWQRAIYPVLLAALALSLGLYLMCLGMGTLFVRVAIKRC